MARAVIDIDDEKSAEVSEIFGTKAKPATANVALGDAVKQGKRVSFLAWIAGGGLSDLTGDVPARAAD